MAIASALYPVSRRFIGLAKEVTAGTIVAPTFTHPMTKFTPKDNITYLEDKGWRNSMAELYNLIEGVEIAELDMEGPFFGDGAGYNLANILGDYWQSVNGTPGTATTLSASYTAGATTIVVTSATGLTTGATFAVGTVGSTAEEVRTVASAAGTTITLSSPLYQNHASTSPVTPYSAVTTIVHNFSLLNNGIGMGGTTQAQPPTYTWTDYTGVSATSGARNYAYTCLSEFSLTGTANALLMWDAKATSVASAIAASTPTATVTAVKPEAAWDTTIQIAGVQVNTIEEWKMTLTRKLDPKFTNSGQQSPFAIPRGELGAALSLNFDPAIDESSFLLYLNNTQPTMTITSQNTLTGNQFVSVAMTMQVAAFATGEIEDSKTVFGFNDTVKCVANTTNAGPSGGYSPLSIQLTNAVVSY